MWRLLQIGAALHLAFLLAALVNVAQAQPTNEVIYGLTVRGHYRDALKNTRDHLNRVRVTGGDTRDRPITFLYLGRLNVEVGALAAAAEAFETAETLQVDKSDSWIAVISRERATLHLARFDYRAAQESSARACRLAEQANHPRIRVAYCRAILATAHLRLGELAIAHKALDGVLKAVPKNPAKQLLFAPRILYAASLVESQRGNYAEARQLCRRGLEAVEKAHVTSRDTSLGLLALSEIHLRAGEFGAAREAALKSLETTRQMFGLVHQDAIAGFGLLARIAHNEGNGAEAHEHASNALNVASRVLDSASPGMRYLRQSLEQLPRALPRP